MKINMSKEWLKASKLDLEKIKYIIEVEHLTSVVAFHAQPTIEDAKEFYTLALKIFEDVGNILDVDIESDKLPLTLRQNQNNYSFS